MKISYNRKSDILLIELSRETIDHAEEIDSIIVHFSPKNKPVLLEILDASDFLTKVNKLSITSEEEKLVKV